MSITTLLNSLRDILAGWWRQDRIRISPGDGRLLRLAPVCVATLHGRTVEIVGREVCQSAAGPTVRYDCVTERGPAQLTVRLETRTLEVDAEWSESGLRQQLADGELTVYQTHKTANQ